MGNFFGRIKRSFTIDLSQKLSSPTQPSPSCQGFPLRFNPALRCRTVVLDNSPFRGGKASQRTIGTLFESLCVIRGLRRVSASLQSRIEMPDLALDTFTHSVAGRKGLRPSASYTLVGFSLCSNLFRFCVAEWTKPLMHSPVRSG